MTDGEALLAAILANPGDDTVRLVYADWLQEHGQDERAEFVRVQCRLALGCSVCDGSGRNVMSPCPCSTLRRRERELLGAHRYAWIDGLIGDDWKTCGLAQDETAILARVEFTRRGGRAGPFEAEFRRGFVESLRCTGAGWVRHADAIHWHPTQTVECLACRGVVGKSFGTTCTECDNGRAPRPCPETAHPVTAVTLTTWPVGDEWGDVRDLLAVLDDGRLVYRGPQRKWPGVEFTLPPPPQDVDVVPSTRPVRAGL